MWTDTIKALTYADMHKCNHACTVPDYYPDHGRIIIREKKLLNWWDDKFCSSLYHPLGIVLLPSLPGKTGASTYHLSQTWATPNLGGRGVEWRREWTERIHGLGKGYYLSGHGSLHIFHGCSQGVFSQPLADRIHLKHLWASCGLHSSLSLLRNKWDKKQMRWDLKGHRNAQNIQLYLAQIWLSQNLSHLSFLFLSFSSLR